MRFLIVLAAVFVASCATRSVTPVAPVIACPQPSSETLSAAVKLPEIPELPADPSLAIGVLGNVITRDTAAYAGEVAKRETLVGYGVEKCGWTR